MWMYLSVDVDVVGCDWVLHFFCRCCRVFVEVIGCYRVV